jgi:tetratricopeptide (TPR) repeat protein
MKTMFSLEKNERLQKLKKDGTGIALIMALVAMFGAIAALRAGNAEEEADVLESRLSQRHLIELTIRKEYNEREAQLFHFDDDYRARIKEGRRLRDEADALRRVDPAGASRRDVQSQVEFNTARILNPYRSGIWIRNYGDPKMKTKEIIDSDVARELRAMGLASEYTSAGETKPGETKQEDSLWRTLINKILCKRVEEKKEDSSSLWLKLQDEIEKVDCKLIRLTIAVVLFVAALGCLTFAELWRQNDHRMKIMLGFGLGVTACGVILAIWADHVSALFFGAVLLLFGLFGFVGVLVAPYISVIAERVSHRMGFLDPGEVKVKANESAAEKAEGKAVEKEEEEEEEEEESPHPGELEPRLVPTVRMHAELGKRAFSILVVLLIVFTVLVSAIIGTVYSMASTEASTRASNAADLLVDGFRNSQTSEAYALLSNLATTQENRLRFQAVLQEANLMEMGVLKGNAEKIDEDKARWATAVGNEDKDYVDYLYGKGGNGPEWDTLYPRGFLNGGAKWGSHLAFAQADSENELSLAYHTRAEQYLTMLTWLAIALYLFGQSLTMVRDLDAASMLVVFGVFLVAIVVGFGTVQGLRRISGKTYTESQACRDPKQTEATKEDPKDVAARHYAAGRIEYDTARTQDEYHSATQEFECAAEARPTFSLANYYLSHASQNEKSPQNGESFTSLFSEDAIGKVVERENKAMTGFDRESFSLNADLMGNLGWDTYSLGLVKKDLKGVKKGMKETQEAVNDDENKEHKFLDFNLGVTRLAAGDFEGAKDAYKKALAISSGADLQSGLAAANINDLEVLLHYCSGIRSADDCKKIKSMADDFKQQLVAAAWPAPNGGSGGSPRLRNLWLIAAPAGLGWHAKPENFREGQDVLSVLWYKYEDKWQLWRALPDLSGEVDWKTVQRESDGSVREFRSYLDATGQQSCAQNAQYRAEFYLNGKMQNLQPPPHITPKFAPSTAGIFRDLNVSLCYPEGWGVRWRPGKVDQGMAGGYRNKEFSKGIFAFEYYFPRVNLDESVKKDFALLSMRYLAERQIQFQVAENEQNTCPIYPLGQTVLRMRAENENIHALVRVWSSSEGIVHVGVALHKTQLGDVGRDDLGPESQECAALASMHEISAPY